MADPTTSRAARAEKTSRALAELDAHRADGLRRLHLVQEAQSEGLSKERVRLVNKYAENHPRVRAIDDRLEYNELAMADLRVEIEKTEIEVPEVDPQTCLIHGRVVDESNTGKRGLTVEVSDDGDGPGTVSETTKTDECGHFAIRLSGSASETPLGLVVSDDEGRVLHETTNRFRLTPGQIAYREITLREGKDPAPDPDPEPADEPVDEPVDQPSKEPVDEPVKEPIDEQVDEPREEPVEESVDQPADEPIKEPVDDSSKVPADAWLVHGEVRYADGRPAPDLTVRLKDKDLLFDDLLGTTTTSADGLFRLSYRAESSPDLFEKNPELYLAVLDKERQKLYESQQAVRAGAGKVEEFKVVLEMKSPG